MYVARHKKDMNPEYVYRRRRVAGVLIILVLVLISFVACQITSASTSHDPTANMTVEQKVEYERTGKIPETLQDESKPFEADGVLVVNKKHPLPATFNPGENLEARQAVDRLVDDANDAGIDLTHIYSSFRSFEYQVNLYNRYVQDEGKVAADTFSARPGYSEHQSGLAFDLMTSDTDYNGLMYRQDDPTYDYNTDWVAQHCANYGFIIRFRDEWEPTTGYVGEPWHLRYLGIDLAQKVFASGKSLEEYLGVDGGDYM
ncbi:hypothetical protein FACS1894125_4320 [Actinomycetota bacterium]|nr:hypothetical protein FACS1894125_4320 [Actinomycetota bacterium]